MRPTRTTLSVAALLFLSTGLTACGGGQTQAGGEGCKPQHTFETVTKGKLTVAGYDLPPFGARDGNGMKGVDADILKHIAAKECLEVEAKWMAPAAVIPTVQSGRADTGIPDWYRTKARAEIVTLTDPMYLDQMAISSKEGISSISALKGKQVGTVDGYLWVDDLKKYLGSSLKIYPSTVNLNQDLKAGRIAIAVDSFGSQKATNPGNQIKVAEPDPAVAASKEAAQAAFPVPKQNTALVEAFNAHIKQMHADGTFAKILKDNGLEESAADVGQPRLIG